MTPDEQFPQTSNFRLRLRYTDLFPEHHPTHNSSPYPAPVSHLFLGEDPKDVQFGVGGEAEAVGLAGDHARHERAVADGILQGSLRGPVGALLHPAEVRVVLLQTRVEDGHLDAFACRAGGSGDVASGSGRGLNAAQGNGRSENKTRPRNGSARRIRGLSRFGIYYSMNWNESAGFRNPCLTRQGKQQRVEPARQYYPINWALLLTQSLRSALTSRKPS